MRLVVVGSSDAFNSAGRGHSCYLLEGGSARPIMVDFGATALRGILALGRDPRSIGTIVFTHLHGDHIGGYPFLYIDAMFNHVRTEPLEIVGPVGTEARLDLLLRTSYGDIADRPTPFSISIREVTAGQTTTVQGAQLETFAASHMDPPEQPLCLRITGQDGRIAAFSGDTEICAGMRDAARGAHLFVAECTALEPPAGRHCTWVEWQVELPKIDAARVLLSHLGEDVRREASAAGRAELAFADDGLIVEV